ncbi:conserved hypothetical protein [Malacoplasma penetrans HF-2]|uniref:Uncharacterized protein n=1 Tax=Malacoplasma penetrans (strain HF-2) TaxID=272633 RepID=Q8EVD5_MALP2|nr:hypothetical protein [Malacoplasma penetrans]BAC44419.1 conserved hypothetical protein [Malacoplasma penetrans HF-2]
MKKYFINTFCLTGVNFIFLPNFQFEISFSNNLISASIENTIYENKWIDSIKESSKTTNPKLFFNRNATLAYQQAILVSEYMLLEKENRAGNDDILFFYNNSIYESNTWASQEWESKFLKNNQSFNNWNFKLVNNTSKIDSSFGSYKYEQYPDENITNYLLNYYTKKDSNIMFDVWIVDGGLEDLFNYNKSSYEFIKHVNKIYVLTDGNYQPYYFVNNAIKEYKTNNYKQLTSQEVAEKFNTYKSDSSNSLKSDFNKYKLYDFIHNSDIFTFFPH